MIWRETSASTQLERRTGPLVLASLGAPPEAYRSEFRTVSCITLDKTSEYAATGSVMIT